MGKEKTEKENVGKNKKNLGIKLKLLSVLLPVVICVIAVIIIMVYSNAKNVMLDISEEHVLTSTQRVVNQVKAWMNETITALDTERDTMEYMDMNKAEMLDYVKHTANVYDSFPAGIYVAISDTGELIHSAFVPGPEYDVYKKPWYIDGLVSEEFIFGSVYFDEDSQSYVVGASGVQKDGKGNVIGVAAGDIYLDAISTIVNDVQLEETGGVFLVDGITNMIIGHKDESVLGVEIGSLEDEMYSYVNQRISNNALGLDTMKNGAGQTIYVDVETVPDSEWIAVAYVPESEILAELNTLTRRVVLVALIGCILVILLMERFIHMVVKPVKTVSGALDEMTRGDFTVSIEVRTSDEIGVMAHGMRRFIRIMNDTIRQIKEVSHTLILQADNSARISTDLSGAAASMEEAGQGVQTLMDSIQGVSRNARDLSEIVAETGEKGQAASAQMHGAVKASEQGRNDIQAITGSMEQILAKMEGLEESTVEMGGSLDKINNMVGMIENIAEQTNLLALNASIEAARAGEAGKGFAVVAGEIGTLAATSKEAVSDISKLTAEISQNIRRTIDESRDSAQVIRGSNEVVDKTRTAFDEIYSSVTETSRMVNEMTSCIHQVNEIAATVVGSTQEQTELSETILVSITEMERNAQTVSAHSNEMATDVEGLKNNAALLDDLMQSFKI